VTDIIATAGQPSVFVGLVTLWLWATVLFANLAEAVAEGRGKAQADTLRRGRKETTALRLRLDGGTQEVPAAQLRAGDLCVVTAGQVIPGDGDVIEGMAVVDESAITGESAPVIRESGGDRSAVTGGTVVLSDRIVVRVTSAPGATFLDRMIALVEGANRQKTPNEVALDILIAGLTLILLVAVVTLQPMASYDHAIQSTAVLVALFVGLAPPRSAGCMPERFRQLREMGIRTVMITGNMVDLDSNPTKLITRGSLTTFSIANDVAKYFAIIPAMFDVAYPPLRVLNVMHLDNPHTAILAAVIYNALIIPALIPLALRGVRFRPLDGAAILRRNGLIYGVGGIVAPFVLIKVFDLLLAATGLH
jgi:high-affinity K+ transport system ATPase subunit B